MRIRFCVATHWPRGCFDFPNSLVQKSLIGLLDRTSIEKIRFVVSTLAEIIGELTNINPVDGELGL